MIAAVVVVVGSAVFAALCAVPDVRKLCHRGGLFAVELFKESRVNCSAVAAHSALVYSDCLGDQGFVACHKVCEVSEALRCVSLGSNVAVDSTSPRVITARSCLSEPSHKLLQGFDVCVVQDRCDQFALFAVGACDADVLLEFPLSALCIPCAVGFVAVAVCGVLGAAGAEEVGGELCGSLAGDVVHLDLHPYRLLLHSALLLCGLLSHFCILRFGNSVGLRPSLCHILPSFGGYSKPLKPQNIEENTLLISGVCVHLIYLKFYGILGYNGIGSLIFRSPHCGQK